MTATVIITGIGGSIGIDIARSLRRGDPSLTLIGCDANPWGRMQTAHLVDDAVALPRADKDPRAYLAALESLAAERNASFVFVNPDPELEGLAAVGEGVTVANSMPPIDTVKTTLDKAATVARTGLAADFPSTFELGSDGDLAACFDALRAPLWMRSTIGPGGRGSLKVDSAAEAQAWIDYWAARGKEYRWVLQEFLPGRNLNWTGLYAGGELVATAAMERLRYFLGETTASGVSGQVSMCKTIDPTDLRGRCDAVVRALDDSPHGIYSVDLREDSGGQAMVTEVNPRLAGRPWLYTCAGLNLPLAAVRALTGQPIGDASGELDIGLHLYRQLDVEPVVGRPD